MKYDCDDIGNAIVTVRGQKVILDSDLARIYQVETRTLNQAVKRNQGRFPGDFLFKLTMEEADHIRRSRSQSVILNRGDNIKYLPHAFTEHGAIMAATVLNSPRAVQMSVFVVRVFVRMRQALMSRVEMEKRLDQIEKILLVHDNSLRDLYEKIRPLLLPPPDPSLPEVKGFRACHAKSDRRSMVKERRARYIVRRRK